MTPADPGGHTPTVDLTTDAGQAIVELFRSIKEDIEESDGSWSGGDTVQALTLWFMGLGIDVELPADDLPGVNPNHCRYCGAHLAEPHGSDCPDAVRLDHDDNLSGVCTDAEIILTYRAPVYVTVGGGAVRQVRVNDQAAELQPGEGGECTGCHRVLLADHPAVAAAAAVAEDGGTEWAAWEIGP